MTYRVVVLDIGHGNCAVVHDGRRSSIIDAGCGGVLFHHLEGCQLYEIENLLISHGDRDHLAGAAALLTSHQFAVRRVYVNPDAPRDTVVWRHFLKAVKVARSRGTKIFTSLTSTSPGSIDGERFSLEVVAPLPERVLRGQGRDGLSANSLSAVVRVVADGVGLVLLAADMDQRTLELIQEEKASVNARVLVFPHHGGRPGRADPETFARELCASVVPERVVFSIARHHKDRNPLPEVIQGVRAAVPKAHISCTQLSKNCRGETYNDLGDPLQCNGTLEIGFPGAVIRPSEREHAVFISKNAPTALCRPDLAEQARLALRRS